MTSGTAPVPVLETERLILRDARVGDLAAHAAMLADPAVVRFVGGKPLSREEAWRKMLAGPGMWALLGFGYWTVERKADGRVLGQAGFGDFKRDIAPSLEGIPEMGWLFASWAHGQGYASEAIAAGLAWADARFPGSDFVAIIDPDNGPSLRVAEKAGFSERQESLYQGDRILILRRRARERS